MIEFCIHFLQYGPVVWLLGKREVEEEAAQKLWVSLFSFLFDLRAGQKKGLLIPKVEKFGEGEALQLPCDEEISLVAAVAAGLKARMRPDQSEGGDLLWKIGSDRQGDAPSHRVTDEVIGLFREKSDNRLCCVAKRVFRLDKRYGRGDCREKGKIAWISQKAVERHDFHGVSFPDQLSFERSVA